MAKAINRAFSGLRELVKRHRRTGQALYDSCAGHLFPVDGLAMAVLDRSLNLAEGFLLLMPKHGFICAAALLRLQLDNVLRFHGVLNCVDPHDTAARIISGISIRKLKDKTGQRMVDARLVELLEKRNPWVRKCYEQSSDYVHLSDAHIRRFLARSTRGKDGRRIFRIGNNDDHMSLKDRGALITSFTTVTRGVLSLIDLYTRGRAHFGSPDDLLRRFQREP